MAGEFAVLAVVTVSAYAMVSALPNGTDSSIQARRVGAEVNLDLAVSSHVTGLAVAVVVIDQLDAVQGSRVRAWVRQTLVDVAFTAGSYEARWTAAFESSNLVDTAAVVVASTRHAVVRVDLAQHSERSRWTRALVVVDQIVADTSVAARVWLALVDVEFAVLTLEALLADALV